MKGAPNALTSLWGRGGAVCPTCGQKRKANSVRDSMIGQGVRQQKTFTPPWMLNLIADEWDGITLDAAAAPHLNVPAIYHYVWPHRDGLALDWVDRTWCNPQFKDLKLWLAKAALEAHRFELRWLEPHKIALLAPVRTHRKWYRAATKTCTARIVLNPFSFWESPVKKYPQSFPAPCEILCWNWQPTPGLWKEHGDVV